MSENVNTTMNGTQPSCFSSTPTAETIGITFAYCLIFIVSLAGNTFIGIIVYKAKTMRKPINFFIVNMTMSDLFFPIIVIPMMIQTHYTDSWLIGGPLGQALCKLSSFLQGLSIAVSIQSLVLIAVDRFGAAVFPLRSPLISSKLCPFFILATWIVAIAVNSPMLFVSKLVEYPEERSCENHWRRVFREYDEIFENYFVSYIVIFNFIPLVLIAILYIIIYLKLKSQKIPGEHSANAGQQRQKRERNALKMATAIVLGFAVCWLPHAILFLLLTSRTIWPNCVIRNVVNAVNSMVLANSAINPCICLILSRNYRNELRALFR